MADDVMAAAERLQRWVKIWEPDPNPVGEHLGDVRILLAELHRVRAARARDETVVLAAIDVSLAAWTDRFSRLHGHPSIDALNVAIKAHGQPLPPPPEGV